MSDKGAILVTGGAGYIGSHAAWAVLDRGEKVVVLDDLSEGVRELVPKDATFVKGDVHDETLLRKTIEKYSIDTILHFAAFVRADESVLQAERYLENNVGGTEAIVKVSKKCGIKHFIFSSSAAVYGDAKENPIPEDAPLKPLSPYAESKIRAEDIVMKSGLKAVSLRYFNPAGTDPAGRTGYKTDPIPPNLVRNAVCAALRMMPEFKFYGTDYPTPDGTCIRDFIHVSDLADAHVSALSYLRDGGATRIFNCGSGRGYSVTEVVKAVKKVSGYDFPVVVGDRRPGDPVASVADISRIKRELGWKPKRDLQTMVKDELSWVMVHKK